MPSPKGDVNLSPGDEQAVIQQEIKLNSSKNCKNAGNESSQSS